MTLFSAVVTHGKPQVSSNSKAFMAEVCVNLLPFAVPVTGYILPESLVVIKPSLRLIFPRFFDDKPHVTEHWRCKFRMVKPPILNECTENAGPLGNVFYPLTLTYSLGQDIHLIWFVGVVVNNNSRHRRASGVDVVW